MADDIATPASLTMSHSDALTSAVMSDDVKFLSRHLTSSGEWPQDVDQGVLTALFCQAAHYDSWRCAEWLIPLLRPRALSGRCLLESSACDRTRLVTLLVNNCSISGSYVDDDRCNALHHAVIHSNATITDSLLTACTNDTTRRALLSGTNSSGDTPLHLAAQIGDAGVMRVMLSHCGRDSSEVINAATSSGGGGSSGVTPLHVACMAGHPQIVALLLAQDTWRLHVDRRDSNGHTPLHLAATAGMEQLYSGVQEENNNITADSALLLKVRDYLGIVSMLLRSGAHTDVPGGRGSRLGRTFRDLWAAGMQAASDCGILADLMRYDYISVEIDTINAYQRTPSSLQCIASTTLARFTVTPAQQHWLTTVLPKSLQTKVTIHRA